MPAKPKPSRQVVGENVARFRRNRKMSQKELAKQAGVRQPMVSKIEQAKHDPQCATLDRLAGALDVEPAALLTPAKKS